MKTTYLALLLSLLTIGTYAQAPVESSDESNVQVIKKTWRFQVRNPALDESPFLEMEERLQAEQDVRDNAAENRRRAKMGLKPVRAPERPTVARNDGPVSFAYVYEIKVRNAGDKAIRALILEYVFLEPNTEREVGRRQFVSKKDIAPGKTKNLVFRSAAPPTGTINVKEAGKKTRYAEQVIIRGVEYNDGSAWQVALKKQ